jgi:hypothetical protein
MLLVPSQLAGLPAQRHPTADSTEAVGAGLLASVGGASDRPRDQLPACCPSTSPGRSGTATMPLTTGTRNLVIGLIQRSLALSSKEC